MNAMFLKDCGVLMAAAIPWWSLSIWLCMYICQVLDDHRPIFWMVESLYPMSFRAIAPPALRECDPTRSGSMPWRCSLREETAARVDATMSELVTAVHLPCWKTSHMRLSSVPPCCRICPILLARAATPPLVPVDSM